MQFGVENLTAQNGVASVDLAQLNDEQLVAARAELDAAGEARGLWLPAAAGELVVATTVDVPALRRELLASAQDDAQLYIDVMYGVNSMRTNKHRIPVLEAEEYAERAADWLTDERVKAAAVLPASEARPRILVPRLSRAISTAENVEAWSAAADRGIYDWADRMKFLSNWSDNQLSGFDPSLEDEVSFAVVPTAYDEAREGTVEEQVDKLEEAQAVHSEIGVTPIFGGTLLAQRYKGRGRVWSDSYVKGINLKPAKVDGDYYVPDASVNGDGGANVYNALVQNRFAARLQVI